MVLGLGHPRAAAPTRWLGALGVVVLALAASTAVTAVDAASAAPFLRFDRAVRAAHAFAAAGCTPGHHCRSWTVSECKRRSRSDVSCMFEAEVRSKPCTTPLSSFIQEEGRRRRLAVTADAVKACTLELWPISAPPSFRPAIVPKA